MAAHIKCVQLATQGKRALQVKTTTTTATTITATNNKQFQQAKPSNATQCKAMQRNAKTKQYNAGQARSRPAIMAGNTAGHIMAGHRLLAGHGRPWLAIMTGHGQP